MPITVACQCGQQFAADDQLAGKQVNCPSCGSMISIPMPQQQPLAAPSHVAPQPIAQQPLAPQLAAPQTSPAPMGQGPASMGQSPGWPAQPTAPMKAGYAQPQYPVQQKQGMSTLQIAMIVGGVTMFVGMIGIVLVVMFLLGSSPDQNEVAQNQNVAEGNGAANVSDPINSDFGNSNSTDNSTDNGSSSSRNSDSVNGSGTSASETTNHDSPARVDSVVGGSPVDNTTRGRKLEVATPVPSSRSLSKTIVQWHGSRRSMRGAHPIQGEDLVIYHYSWMCDLLPLIGRERLFNQINFRQPWTHSPNRQLVSEVIPEFQNPADSRRQWTGLGREIGMGLTHFVGMSGVEDSRNVVAANLPRSDPRAGVFGYNQVARPNQITDGTSQTIMIIGNGEFANPWVQGGGATVRGAREPYFDDAVPYFGSRGLAQKGAFAVMADGSVRMIQGNVEPATFRATCTIHGSDSVDMTTLGEPLDGFSLR